MSTKCTIAHGPNFHLYQDVFDDDYVYLDLKGAQFEASPDRISLPIPVHIWEVIRSYSAVSLEYADKTDDELRQYVEREVDERMRRNHEAEGDERARSFVSGLGAFAFGSADQSRQEQIAAGIEHYSKVRDRQRQVMQAITELEQLNRR